MVTQEELVMMQNVEITSMDRDTLINIEQVIINESLSTEEKIEHYMDQIKNPYCFLSGKIPTRIRFVETKKTLSQSLGNYFISLK